MNVLTGEFWLALLNIIFIDLILAGDNAIVIALAARNLPKDQQKKAVIWGTVGAISIRIVATLLVVKLLDLPWLHLVGGLLLIWIAFKLLVQEEQHDNVKAGNTLWQSIQTIIIADAAMGLDNVIAVAGAAQGHMLLVVIGLLISVPVIVWGSTLFIKLVDRFKWIIYVGAAVLAYTASKMFIDEHKFGNIFEENVWLQWAVKIVLIVGILGLGYMVNKRNAKKTTATS
ncbi:TerC family protein [Paenibacillus endoradicis]|uniref:TerC family protein n=1 Tax=Paenibacillus endoradicis TaxID=2972487 RepID=UPI0021591B47|nr:TerC family protein [Paenibacillus endoradicis]MCR8655976.1 TerC family protein [Paenibacillus endoradicis]MCR8658302.1 TerC family protein [Paenibacillus endoradicis]